LSAGGERLFLINSNQTRVIDVIDFEAQARGVSSGRFADGAPSLASWRSHTWVAVTAVRCSVPS
jgi:hypothetical protein